ncbi:MAG: translocation/assembly module TamB domain-containing protein [Pseudomonadota bacterium]
MWVAAVLLLVLLLLVLTLVYTHPGLRLAARVASGLEGVELRYDTLEGSLASLDATNLTVSTKDLRLRAKTLTLRWSPAELIGPLVKIERLAADGLTLTLPNSNDDISTSSPPSLAPPEYLQLPVEVMIDALVVTNLTLDSGDSAPLRIDELTVSARLMDDQWEISRVTVSQPDQRLSASARLKPNSPFDHRLAASVTSPELELSWQSEGDLNGSAGSLRGRQGDQPIDLSTVRLAFSDARWRLEVGGQAGPIELQGTAALDALELFAADVQAVYADPAGDLQDLEVTVSASGPFEQLGGRLELRSNGLRTLGPIDGETRFSLQSFEQLVFSGLLLATPDGRVSGGAQLRLSELPQADFDLRIDDVKLARVHPALTGFMAGTVRAQTRGEDGKPASRLTLDLASEGIDPPLSINGNLMLAGATPASGQLTLAAGAGNQLELDLPAPDQLNLDLNFENLQSLWPDLAGRMTATLVVNPAALIELANDPTQLAGADAWPPLTGRIDGRAMALGEYRLGEVKLALTETGPTLDVTDLTAPQAKFRRAMLTIEGSPASHRTTLDADSPLLNARLGSNGSWAADAYRFVVDELMFEAEDLPALRVTESWRGSVSADAQQLEPGCLSGTGMQLCLAASNNLESRSAELELSLDADAISASSWRRWWPTAPAGLTLTEPVTLTAGLAQDVKATAGQNTETDRINVSAKLGGIELPAPQTLESGPNPQPLRPLRDLEVSLIGNSRSADLKLSAGLADGSLAATGVVTDLFAMPSIDASVGLETDSLDLLSSLLPDVDLDGGPLTLDLTVRGPAQQAAVTGTASVRQVTAAVPRLNISPLLDFDVRLPAAGQGTFEGTVQSGEGQGSLRGSAEIDEALQLAVDLDGDRLLIADSDTLSLVASPDLSLRMDGAVTRVTGEVTIDKGMVALTTGSSSVQASPDVVIVDAETNEPSRPQSASELDVRVRFDEPVPVTGYGLRGEISGSLRVRQKPKGPMLGNGELQLTGSYGAFGQRLIIERGTLNYVETPLNDPTLDFFAYRQVGDTKVGIQVSGRASSLSARLQSDPPINEADQLAMLVLGERSNGLNQSQSDQLASAALGLALAQGNKRLGALGDEGALPQVSLTQELGGLAVAVGKQISPKLYVGYTVDLLEPIQLIRLRYRISDLWTAESELGQESRVAFRYRVER